MPELHKEDILQRLEQLDKKAALLFHDNRRFRLVIVGGSAMILLGAIHRFSHDIDALEASGDIVRLLREYDINTDVCAFADNFPLNYDDRLVPIMSGKKIEFYTASLEDVVIAKIYAGRDQDIRDITNDKVLSLIDWKILDRLATADDEVNASFLNPYRYAEFLSCYYRFVERWKPCKSLHSEDFLRDM